MSNNRISVKITISTPAATALLELLKTSNSFPDVVEALQWELEV